jgi:acyl-CoA synthetase (AMP-forming)/AMP-acid ligase II
VIAHTSGTTGKPKATVLGHSELVSGIESVMLHIVGGGQRSEAGPKPRGAANIVAFPWFHMSGMLNMLLGLRNDREILLMPKFEPETFATLVDEHRILSVIINPTMMAMILDAKIERSRLSSLRFVRSGSAALPRPLAEMFVREYGVPVLNCYGQTETNGEVIGWTAQDARNHLDEKLGSVGRPHAGVTLRFIDDEGVELAPGEVGELCVHSAAVTRRSLTAGRGLPEDRFTRDGFLRTGDIGYVDPDGFVWLTGRRSDVIVCGGFKIYPEEVETAISTLDGVREVMVAGLEDQRLGEAPHAFIVWSGPPVDDATLVALLREKVAAYKVPRHFHRVEALPRNELGKLLRRRAGELVPSPAAFSNVTNPERNGELHV